MCVKKRKILGILVLVVLALMLIRYVVFQKEINSGISLFEIDEEQQLVLFPFLNGQSKTLSMERIILASRFDERHLISNATFTEDAEMYFIMANVSGLRKEDDGASWYDADVHIIRQEDNATVLALEKNLGEKGKQTLATQVISPYGTVHIPWTAKSGNYTLLVTFYDIYANTSIERNATFSVRNSFESVTLPDSVSMG